MPTAVADPSPPPLPRPTTRAEAPAAVVATKIAKKSKKIREKKIGKGMTQPFKRTVSSNVIFGNPESIVWKLFVELLLFFA